MCYPFPDACLSGLGFDLANYFHPSRHSNTPNIPISTMFPPRYLKVPLLSTLLGFSLYADFRWSKHAWLMI